MAARTAIPLRTVHIHSSRCRLAIDAISDPLLKRNRQGHEGARFSSRNPFTIGYRDARRLSILVRAENASTSPIRSRWGAELSWGPSGGQESAARAVEASGRAQLTVRISQMCWLASFQ